MKNHTRAGQSAIGLLVSAFLIIGAVAFFFAPRKGEEKTAIKRSMDMAETVAVDSNIGQIRQMIGMYKSDNDGKPPASLEELKKYCKFPDEMWINSVDKKPLIYNPASGEICAEGPGCPAPGTAAVAAPAPDGNPTPPGSAPAAPAPPAAEPVTGRGMKIPQPGAGAAEAMRAE